MHRIVFLFFFLSGFSTLVYEVAWVRILALTLGNTAYATSTVLAVFMGGLALGAYFGGRLADKMLSKHLRLYGMIELSVAVLAPLVTYLLNIAPSLYANLIGAVSMDLFSLTVVRFLFSIVLLLLPCLLMGATLPAIIRYVKNYSAPPELFAALYGINTLGAAAGSLFACFVGFTYIGLNATIFCAAAINMVIGVVAFLLEKKSAEIPRPAESAYGENESSEVQSGEAPKGALLLTLSALTGFTALCYEVLWIRMLTFYLGSLTYTFTTTVSTILLGLALGSFLYKRFLYKDGEPASRTFTVFAATQYAAAAATAAALFATPWLASFRGAWLLAGESGFNNMGGQLAYTVCMSAACLFIPATLIGALFPALGTMAVASKNNVATAVGRVYALNTIGCVVGSLAAGLLLIPSLGWFSSFLWILVISLVTGLLALSYGGTWKSPRALAWSVPPLVAAIAFASIAHYKPPLNPACKLLFYGEDSFGAVEIVDDPKLMEGKTLVFNGSCLATTVPNSLRYMRLLGHLPVLLHPRPEKALVGCFGTGSTSGAIAIHPEVKHLDIVELSSMILKQNKLFAAENHDVLANPKVKAQVNDVRNYLLCTKEKYDVVTFEPPPPSDAGIVNLYTSEFYQLVQKRLNPGGIMCQWAPVACGSAKLWKMMVMTARTVYPYVSIWFPNSHEAIIVASDEPIKIDFDQIQNRIDESPAVAESLRGVGMGDANALIATFAVADKELDDFLGELPAITDDHPSLEFFLPYAGAWLTDLEIEAPGKAQIAGLAHYGSKFKAFDKKKFEDNWVAIHLLRMAQYNPTDGAKCVDDALKMMPDNPWFQWVHRHKNMAVKGLI